MEIMLPSHRGGYRPGSGRKLSIDKQIARAQKLAKQLQIGRTLGFLVLAEKAPEIVALAVKLALGTETERPSLTMLKACMEMLSKLPSEGAETDESPIADLLKRLKANVNIQVNNYKESLGRDATGDIIEAEYRSVSRVEEDIASKPQVDVGDGGRGEWQEL